MLYRAFLSLFTRRFDTLRGLYEFTWMTNKDPLPGAAVKGRRARKAAEMRDRIFRAAIELYAERGLANVTVEQITERADVGKGTFFNYFTNKEAILAYFGSKQVERLEQAMSRGEIQGSAAQRIIRTLELLASYPDVTPSLTRDLFVSALRADGVTEAQGASIWHLQGLIAGIIREGQSTQEIRSELAPQQAALFLLGQYFLAQLAWCTEFSDSTLPETTDRFVRMALQGVCRMDGAG